MYLLYFVIYSDIYLCLDIYYNLMYFYLFTQNSLIHNFTNIHVMKVVISIHNNSSKIPPREILHPSILSFH